MPLDTEWQGEPHTLTVHSISIAPSQHDGGEFEYDLEHPPTCQQEDMYDGRVRVYVCDVGWQEGDIGLADSLQYSGTPITEPGTYRIAAWGRKTYYYWSGYEYDAGITILPAEGESDAA
jgi:hypothetical protein